MSAVPVTTFDVNGFPVPAGTSGDDFIGSAATLNLSFSNGSATDPGYAPFIDVTLPAGSDGVSFTGATYLGSPVTAQSVTFDSNGHASNPFVRDANGNPVVVDGPAGGTLVVLQLPFGSFTPGQTPADIAVNLAVSPDAVLGAPLDVTATGGFAFGNQATGVSASNPPIIGAQTNYNVVPQLVTLQTVYEGPEQETATGPSYPHAWDSVATIAPGQTLTNLVLTQKLPDGAVFLPGSSQLLYGGGAASGTVTFDAATNTVTGTFTQPVTGGAAGSPPTLQAGFYVTQDYANPADGTAILDPVTGAFARLTDSSTLAANWHSSNPVNPSSVAAGPAGNTITAKSIAEQKGVTDLTHTQSAYQPGDTLQYSLDGQVSNYFDANDLVLTDTLGDGQTFKAGFTPSITIADEGHTLYSGAVAANEYTVSFKAVDGTSVVTFDVSKILADNGQSTDLDGGTAANPNPATADAVFQTTIDTNYSATPAPPVSTLVDQGDTVGNAVVFSGEVASSGDAIRDNSGAGITLPTNTVAKSVYAVNGHIVTGPVTIQAGDLVTYDLQLTTPLTSTQDVALTDFLPLPTFSATDPNADGSSPGFTFIDAESASAPAVGTAEFGPADTFMTADPADVPAVSENATANSLTFDFGNYTLTPTYPGNVIDVLYTVRAGDQPFKDGLLLTNQVHATETNSFGTVTQTNAIVQVKLGEPVLKVEKAVEGTDDPNAVLVGSPGPGSALNDQVLAATPLNDSLHGIVAGDTVAFKVVVQNTGTGPNGAFDVVLHDTLPAGFIDAHNILVTDGAGNPLAYTTLGGGLFDPNGGIQLTDGATGALAADNATSGANIAVITYSAVADATVPVPDYDLRNTATVTHYAAEQGGVNDTVTSTPANLSASTNVYTATPGFAKTVISTEVAAPTSGSPNIHDLAIGDEATYDITLTLTKGTADNVTIADLLPHSSSGELDLVSASVLRVGADVVGSTLVAGDGANLNGAFDFGNLTDASNAQGTDDQVVVQVTAKAVNDSNNKGGEAVTNTATLSETNPNNPGGAPYTQTAKTTETLVEPQLHLAKTASTAVAQAGDVITYELKFSDSNGTGSAAAYNSVITDALNQLGVNGSFVEGSVKIAASTATGATIVTGNTAGDTSVAVDVAEIDPGQEVDVTYKVAVPYTAVDATTLPNTAVVSAATLPGGNPDARTETASGSADVTIQPATITKTLIAGSDPNIAVPDLAPGETGTYQLVLTLPHGATPDFWFTDQFLGQTLSYVAGTAHIVSIGSNLSGVVTNLTTGPYGNGFDGYLGFIQDSGAGADTAADQIVLDYQAIAAANAQDTAGTQAINDAAPFTNGIYLPGVTATAYIVAPNLTLTKTASTGNTPQVAGADVTYTLTLHNTGTSPGYDVNLSDVLPSDETYVAGSLTGANASISGNTITVSDPSLAAGGTAVITYRAQLDESVTPGEQITNNAAVTYATQPTGGCTEPTVTAHATVPVNLTPTETKTILSLSNGFSTTQVVTGETVTYQLLTTLQPGTQEFRLADTLPAGLSFVSATVASVGADIGGVATGAFTPSNGVYDFGTVTVTPGAADQVALDVTARVDLVAGGTSFTNSATAEVSVPGSTSTGLETSTSTAPMLTDVKASLSGMVFLDNNDDGVKDGADAGVPGVTVELLDSNGQATGVTTITDAHGRYSFGGLELGSYSVQVVAPGSDGFSPQGGDANPALDSIVNATGATATVTLQPGGDTPNQNAGIYAPVAFSGTVFNDQNADGAQESGDHGYAGDTVTLYSGGGAIATATTDASGNYSFTGLKPGAYSAAITDPAGDSFSPVGTSASAPNSIVNGSGSTPTVSLTSGQSATAQDAGVYGPGSLSGTVFTDNNDDGVTDGADTGLAGVTVELLDSTGTTTGATAITDANGNYDFAGLHPSTYSVQVVAPGTDGFSPVGSNPNPALDSIVGSTGATSPVAVLSNTDTPNQNAGVYVPVSIAGVVFTDQNADGVKQPGDAAIAGDTVTLLNGGTAIASTTTAADGSYSFTGLQPGSYTVDVTDPAGDRFSAPGANPNPALDSVVGSTGATPTITLTSGQSAPYENAGAYAPATLSGHAFFDSNGDGQQESGEPDLQGVTVTLLDVGGHPTGVTATAAADGSYSFAGLVPGTYSVAFTTPTGDYISQPGTNPNAALDSIIDGAGDTAPVTLVSGQTVANQNAGFTQVGSLSGTVFTDNNDDGVIDGADSGLAGVTVKLLDGTGHPTGATTTTDAQGNYSFGLLQPGHYSVQVIAPGSDGFSPVGTNADAALDSEVNAAGATSPVSVVAGHDTPNQNAGLYAPVSFSGNVFIDQNADGVKEAGDTNLPGDTVTLYSGAAAIATTTTDANGNYSFTGLKPGTYSATIGAPGSDRFSPVGTAAPPAEDSIVNAGGSTPPVTLASGQSATAQDAGLYAPAEIAGRAFLDAHCDGTDDYGNPAFAGVTVKLLDGAGVFTGLTTTTDANGEYSFGSLTPGQYQVQFVAPIGTAFTDERVGSDNTINSDADRVTGKSEIVTLTSGETDPTHGVGLHLTGGYSNFPTTYLGASQTVGVVQGSGTVIGGPGMQPDLIDGGTGTSVLVGGMGDNTIEGGSGTNLILGGCGPQAQIQALGTTDIVFGGPGNDLIQGHSGNEFLAAGVGDQTIFAGPGGHDTFIANANSGTITDTNGVFSNIVIGDDFETAGNADVIYNKGDGVVFVDDFVPGNGDTLTINGYGAPIATGSANGYDILYFGPNQAVLLRAGYNALTAGDITFSPSGPTTAPLTIAVSASGGLTLTEAGVRTIIAPGQSPVIQGAVSGQTATDAGPVTPFFGVTITDPAPAQTETVTITPFSPLDGTFAQLGGGTLANGAYTITGTPQSVTSATRALQFVPAHLAVGQSLTASFSIAVKDGAGNVASDNTTSLVITHPDLPPVIAGTDAGQAVADTATIQPFAHATVTDPDGGLTETAVVTLSSAANGKLSDAAGGSYNAQTGVFTATGTAQSVTALLERLAFTPTAHQGAAGSNVTTGLTLTVTDSAGGSATDTTTSVIAAQSAAPVVPVVPPAGGGAVALFGFFQSYSGGSAATQVSGMASFNSVVLGDGADTVTLAGYGNRVTVGDGNDTISAGAGGATIAAGNGNDTITAGGDGNIVSVGTGTDTINAGYGATITAAGGNQTITLGGNANTVSIGGAGNATIAGGYNNDSVTGGSGAISVSFLGYGNSVVAGGGNDTVGIGLGNAR